MSKKLHWESRRVQCPEVGRKANLFIEWKQEHGKSTLSSISCDNPRLSDLDNWDCRWSCWEEIERETEPE